MNPPLKARLTLAQCTARNILIESNITQPPVPAKELLERHAVVCWFSDPTEEGFCINRNGKPYVFLNKDMIPGRDRFTFAHELGHVKMNHLDIDQSMITAFHVPKMRQEANYFAACLLMPEDWIRADCGTDTISLSHLKGLVQLYDVSWEAMTNRLHDLEICEKEYIKWMWDSRAVKQRSRLF